MLNNTAKFILNNHYYIFLSIFFIWMGIGCFPLYCYESDSMHTILGCSTVYSNGFNFPPNYHYEYNMQPLIYVIVPFLKYILPLNIEQIFCLLTAIAAMLNIVLCIELVHKLTRINRTFILLSTFLLPESIAIGMYPNTAIFAILFVVIALHLLLNNKFILSTIFLIIAPLFRIDILMVYPVILMVLFWMGYSTKKSIIITSFIAISVLIGLTIGYYILQTNPLTTLNGYDKWNSRITLYMTLKAIFTYYTILNFIFIPIGIYLLFKNKDFKLLFLLMLPILLNHIVYGKMGCATKHFLYMMPFTIALSSYGIKFLIYKIESYALYKYSLIILLILYLCVSIRFEHSNLPWFNQAYSVQRLSKHVNILKEDYTKYKFSIGIGGGLVLRTFDEIMLFSGNLFYPMFIHELKKEQLKKRNYTYNYMKGKTNVTYLGSSWDDMANIAIAYINNGYMFSHKNHTKFYLDNPYCKVSILCHEIGEGSNEFSLYNTWFQEITKLKKENKNMYCFTLIDYHLYTLNQLCNNNIVEKQTDNLFYIK